MAAPDAQAASDSIAAFLCRMRPRLHRFLSRSRIPPLDREDLLQDALVELTAKWTLIQHPEAWLLGTLRNKSLNYLRNRQRGLLGRCITVGTAEELEWLAGPAPAEEQDRWLDVTRLVRTLPARQQRILWLYYGLGLSEHELHEHLSATRPTTMHTLRKDRWRAIGRLRTALLAPIEPGEPTEEPDAAGRRYPTTTAPPPAAPPARA